MKNLILIFFLLTSFVTFSNYFTITDIKEKDRFETESVFPEFHSVSNTEAAEKINTYLQFAVLGNIYGSKTSGIFENVFPLENEYWGQTLYAYTVYRNDNQYLSIGIGYDGLGSYSERYEEFFTFVSSTGEHLLLNDLFSEASLLTVSDRVNKNCANRILEYIPSINLDAEDQVYCKEMYENCLERFIPGNLIHGDEYYMEKEKLVFVKDRCFNHLMASLDELWNFYYEMDLESAVYFFNENALNVYSGEKWEHSSLDLVASDKLYTGKINDKLKITMRLQLDPTQHEISGSYWYDSMKKEIELHGEFDGQGNVILKEYTGETISAVFIGTIAKGIFKGTWTNASGAKHLFFEVGL